MEKKNLRTNPTNTKMTKKTHLAEIQAILCSKGIMLPDKTVSAVYDAFVEGIGAALTDGLYVTVPGLGRFETRHRKAKSFTPPHLDDAIHLKARYVPFFVAGKKLKQLVTGRSDVIQNPKYNSAAETRRRYKKKNKIYDDDEYDYE